jgi:hypothetical protein
MRRNLQVGIIDSPAYDRGDRSSNPKINVKIDIKIAEPAKPVPTERGSSANSLPLQMSLVAGGLLLVTTVIGVGLLLGGKKKPTVAASGIESLPPVSEVETISSEEPEEEVVVPRPRRSLLATEEPAEAPKSAPVVNPQPAVKPPVDAPPPEPAKPKPEPPAKPTPTTPKPTTPAKPPATTSKPTTTPKALPRDKLFQGFPAELSLPAFDAKGPTRLGPVPSEYTCVINLLGGEMAARTRQIYALEPVAGDGDTTAWEIFVRDIGKTTGPKLADLKLRDGGLHFQWTAEAASTRGSGSLRNCALHLAAGSSAHTVQLRKKQALPRLAMLYEKKTYKFALEDPPKAKDIVIELDFVTPKSMPRPRFVGKASIAGNGETVWADFGVKGASYLKLQIDGKCDDENLIITMTPWLQASPTAKPIALTDENLKKFTDGESFRWEQTLQKQLDSLPKKKSPDPQRDALSKQLAAVKANNASIANLKKLQKEFETTGILKIKAYFQAEKALVELAGGK